MPFVLVDRTISVEDAGRLIQMARPVRTRFEPGAGDLGSRQTITIAATTFQALSPPTGSKMAILEIGAIPSLTLKGVTGDTGVKLTPTSPNGMSADIPLGASPSIGVYNGAAASCTFDVLFI